MAGVYGIGQWGTDIIFCKSSDVTFGTLYVSMICENIITKHIKLSHHNGQRNSKRGNHAAETPPSDTHLRNIGSSHSRSDYSGSPA